MSNLYAVIIKEHGTVRTILDLREHSINFCHLKLRVLGYDNTKFIILTSRANAIMYKLKSKENVFVAKWDKSRYSDIELVTVKNNKWKYAGVI